MKAILMAALHTVAKIQNKRNHRPIFSFICVIEGPCPIGTLNCFHLRFSWITGEWSGQKRKLKKRERTIEFRSRISNTCGDPQLLLFKNAVFNRSLFLIDSSCMKVSSSYCGIARKFFNSKNGPYKVLTCQKIELFILFLCLTLRIFLIKNYQKYCKNNKVI